MIIKEKYLHSMFVATFAILMLVVAAESPAGINSLVTEGLLAVGLWNSFSKCVTLPKKI